MRNAFVQSFIEAARADDRLWLVTGDLGYSVLEVVRDEFPDRFINAGIAEQNMMGVAAGLALSGKIPVVYSIANFPTLRCLEQLRNDVCYHGLNVKVVSVGGGVAYGSLGYTHHAVEDFAILGSLPGMSVAAPADPFEAAAACSEIFSLDGPAYLRLGKSGEPKLHSGAVAAPIGQPILVRPGENRAILSTGTILDLALEAGRHCAAAVYSVPWIKPFDAACFQDLLQSFDEVVTIEEHVSGGLGSRVAQVLLEAGWRGRFRSLHLPDVPVSVSGSQESLRARAGLTAEAIVSQFSLVEERLAA